MGEFIKLIRTSKITHPTNQKFDIQEWGKCFNAQETDENDFELYKLGSWIGKKRKQIYASFILAIQDQGQLGQIPK